MLDSHAKEITVGYDETAHAPKFPFWMLVGNALTVLNNIGLAVALCYFLEAVEAWPQAKAAVANLIQTLF